MDLWEVPADHAGGGVGTTWTARVEHARHVVHGYHAGLVVRS